MESPRKHARKGQTGTLGGGASASNPGVMRKRWTRMAPPATLGPGRIRTANSPYRINKWSVE